MPGAPPSKVKSPHATMFGHSQSVASISKLSAGANRDSLAAVSVAGPFPKAASKAVTSAHASGPLRWRRSRVLPVPGSGKRCSSGEPPRCAASCAASSRAFAGGVGLRRRQAHAKPRGVSAMIAGDGRKASSARPWAAGRQQPRSAFASNRFRKWHARRAEPKLAP